MVNTIMNVSLPNEKQLRTRIYIFHKGGVPRESQIQNHRQGQGRYGWQG